MYIRTIKQQRYVIITITPCPRLAVRRKTSETSLEPLTVRATPSVTHLSLRRTGTSEYSLSRYSHASNLIFLNNLFIFKNMVVWRGFVQFTNSLLAPFYLNTLIPIRAPGVPRFDDPNRNKITRPYARLLWRRLLFTELKPKLNFFLAFFLGALEVFSLRFALDHWTLPARFPSKT